jgi:hypothetical protein
MPEKPAETRLSAWGVLAIVVMLGLLAWAVWYAVAAWNSMAGTHISVLGYVFMGLGVVVTFGLGAGLMGLVFYSSRHNLDR